MYNITNHAIENFKKRVVDLPDSDCINYLNAAIKKDNFIGIHNKYKNKENFMVYATTQKINNKKYQYVVLVSENTNKIITCYSKNFKLYITSIVGAYEYVIKSEKETIIINNKLLQSNIAMKNILEELSAECDGRTAELNNLISKIESSNTYKKYFGNSSSKKTISIKDATKILNVSERTIRRNIYNKNLKAIKNHKGNWRIFKYSMVLYLL